MPGADASQQSIAGCIKSLLESNLRTMTMKAYHLKSSFQRPEIRFCGRAAVVTHGGPDSTTVEMAQTSARSTREAETQDGESITTPE
jgi:hypothetical protein